MWADPMSWQGHRELVLYQWAGGWEFSWRREPLGLDSPRLTPKTSGRGLFYSQGKKRLAPEVFILESKTPPPFLEVVLGLLGGGGVSMG